MKVNIDLSSRPEILRERDVLLRQKKDIDIAIGLLELALDKLANDPIRGVQSKESNRGQYPPADVVKALNDLPKQFMVSDVLAACPKLKRQDFKRIKDYWIRNNVIRLLEKRSGRYGNRYEKTS